MSTKVEFAGGFFRRDPGKTMLQNVTKMMAAVAEEGEAAVRNELGTGHAPIAQLDGHHVAEYVHGRVRSLTGKPWIMHAVISVNNAGFSARQGISLMAAASVRETQDHPFRRVTQGLRSARAVLRANLTEGIE